MHCFILYSYIPRVVMLERVVANIKFYSLKHLRLLLADEKHADAKEHS